MISALLLRLRLAGMAIISIILFFAPLQALAGQRLALVIGNGAYTGTAPLQNPPNDARLMTQTLQDTGFAVTTLIDADQRQMKRALLEFGRQLREPGIDAALLFYAGHGVQVNGRNYLIPVNARIQSEDEIDLEGIDVNDLLQVMNSSRSAINIVVLDACRNNPFARSFRAVSRGLAPVDAPKGTLIAYATSPGDVAADGDGVNSPYTSALSQAIAGSDGQTIESVFKAARRNVLALTSDRQVPWETSSITGDFYFRGQDNGKGLRTDDPSSSPTSDPIAEKFAAAREIGSREAWEAFLRDMENADSDNFYVALARQNLQKLAPAHLPSPVRSSDTCYNNSPALVSGRLCVTSFLAPSAKNRYDGIRMLDNRMDTAWVEGVKGDGIGETLKITFDSPTPVKRIFFANGYNKNSDIYSKNGRLHEVTISTSTGKTMRVRLSDNGNWQSIKLVEALPVTWLTIRIDKVYSGWKYNDTAISELRLE